MGDIISEERWKRFQKMRKWRYERGEELTEETPYERSLHEFNVRDEVLKLSLIVEESKAPIYPSYILEKLERISNGMPIHLDLLKQAKFNELKGGVDMGEKLERLKEIIKIADKLKWIYPPTKTSYPLMQLSEVEKCMIAMVDDFELERMRKWYKDGEDRSL